MYHLYVAKAMFMSKRVRPDIHQVVAVLLTRVKQPNDSDWSKLKILIMYLNGTKTKGLFLHIDKVI